MPCCIFESKYKCIRNIHSYNNHEYILRRYENRVWRVFESKVQTCYTNSKFLQDESETYNVLILYVSHARLYFQIKYINESEMYILATAVNMY